MPKTVQQTLLILERIESVDDFVSVQAGLVRSFLYQFRVA